MRKPDNKGFTLVELMIVIGIIAVLMGLVIAVYGPIMEALNNTKCKHNLGQIYQAVLTYKGSFDQVYPSRGGDLFLALLYQTKQLNEFSVYVCPTDKDKDGANFTMDTAKRCLAYEDGVTYEGVEEGDVIMYNPASEQWDDDTFKPHEISYAARDQENEDEDWYSISGSSGDATVLVSDDCQNKKDIKLIHGNHINVLFTNGKIEEMTVGVGDKGTHLEPMKN